MENKPFDDVVMLLRELETRGYIRKERLRLSWKLYRLACDQAEEFVESLKLRIGSEWLVNEATCSDVRNSGVQPISAVRLEQMSKDAGC